MQLLTYLFKVPLLNSYLFSLQGSHLMQIIRVDFCWHVMKFVVYKKYIFWMIKKIDYKNLKICTQSSKQLPTYLFKVPLLFAYLFFLQGNYLVQIIRLNFFNLIKFVVYNKKMFLMIKKIHYQNLKICTQSSMQLLTYLFKVPLLYSYLFSLQGPCANNKGWFFWHVIKFVVYKKYIFWMIKKNDYQNLIISTQSSKQFPTYFSRCPSYLPQKNFLQSSHLVQIIRVDFSHL